MGLVAYELREKFAGTTTVYDTAEAKEKDEGRDVPTFQGGRLALADGSTYDVGDKLEAGGGTIVVEDSNDFLLDVLNAYPALKRTQVPDGAKPDTDPMSLSAAALKQELARRGLPTSGNKEALAKRLTDAREADTGGEGA